MPKFAVNKLSKNVNTDHFFLFGMPRPTHPGGLKYTCMSWFDLVAVLRLFDPEDIMFVQKNNGVVVVCPNGFQDNLPSKEYIDNIRAARDVIRNLADNKTYIKFYFRNGEFVSSDTKLTMAFDGDTLILDDDVHVTSVDDVLEGVYRRYAAIKNDDDDQETSVFKNMKHNMFLRKFYDLGWIKMGYNRKFEIVKGIE